jgi:hypothetical protein
VTCAQRANSRASVGSLTRPRTPHDRLHCFRTRGGSNDRHATHAAAARGQPQWAAPQSTGSELFVSWLLIVTLILVPIVGLIWVIVDAPRLGYRRHDALFALIPI